MTTDKIPDDLRRAVDESPDGTVYTELPAHASFPPMDKMSTMFIAVRDDIAVMNAKAPEEITLIGVRVFYKIGREPKGNGHYYAIAARSEYDPEYAHILEELQ